MLTQPMPHSHHHTHAVALPLGPGLTATAWLESSRFEGPPAAAAVPPPGGGAAPREPQRSIIESIAWGGGLFSRPASAQDLEMGVVLTKPSQHACG